MDPAQKNASIEAALQAFAGFDRREYIEQNLCVPPPIGCGKPIGDPLGMSEIEVGEYRISGLCPTCQKQIFDA